MKGQPSQIANGERRSRLMQALAPAILNVPRNEIRRAPYAIHAELEDAQEAALINHAIELGGPPGAVIARQIGTAEGHTVEVLIGWERLAAFTHPDAYPHAESIPLAVIDCNASHAAFYAIEHAFHEHQAAGWGTSPLLYATAAAAALHHFSQPGKPWKIQTLANALCIHRSTLSNRLRLLRGLQNTTRTLLQEGRIKPEHAKILLAEHIPERQERLATQTAKGMMSTRELYKLVHPDYVPPQLINSPRTRQKEHWADLPRVERAVSEQLGTPATIAINGQKGYIELPFHNLLALRGLIDKLSQQVTNGALLKGHLTMDVQGETAIDTLLQELSHLDDIGS